MDSFDRHNQRDLELPIHRKRLMNNIENDLTQDANVKAIFYGGSLGDSNTDIYSDIDLRIVVDRSVIQKYRAMKKQRVHNWGNILFFEGYEQESFIIAHFDSFIKADIFYYEENELTPSVWLQDLYIVYDPYNIVNDIQHRSNQLQYHFGIEDVEAWRTKYFSFIHEAYRRAARREYYYAMHCIDSLRLSIVAGWYMEMGIQPNSFGDWAKIEGERSPLKDWQLELLQKWLSSGDPDGIMMVVNGMRPEFERLNKNLSSFVGLSAEEDLVKEIYNMVL
ncbi:hypothetical protein [Salicibibacter kimchii]|uniref:Nucleotidyltransferase domain-containing protein n=1 Tax=Salicibibacter kimchii TaxID=2099786 RepID=A0A345BUW3_9BACI|nr:hypothetical protein [Salicibibacter kimchii]AXF54744.1 hypothetical protein DT065_01050 [Salicibibacter kimchii]